MPATAGIYWWCIPALFNSSADSKPTTVGIYWWCIPKYTNHLFIICTKIKIFLAFLQENLQLCHFFL